jgi:hypothetical protein
MSSIQNPASPGTPVQVIAQSQPRDPIAGIPFTSHAANPAVGGIATTFATQVLPVSAAMVEFAGGKNHGVNSRAGKDI